MSLYDIAKSDVNTITGNASEWGKPMMLTAPNAETASINGISVEHHTDFDSEGFPINGRIASIAISEDNVIAANANYPVRDANDEVSLKNHKVTVANSTGEDKTFIINQWHQDETIGLIVCILGDFE